MLDKGESYRYGSPSREKGIEQLNENGMQRYGITLAQGFRTRWLRESVRLS